jgi:hypothetical protein
VYSNTPKRSWAFFMDSSCGSGDVCKGGMAALIYINRQEVSSTAIANPWRLARSNPRKGATNFRVADNSPFVRPGPEVLSYN